jgi:hypothetical protein
MFRDGAIFGSSTIYHMIGMNGLDTTVGDQEVSITTTDARVRRRD